MNHEQAHTALDTLLKKMDQETDKIVPHVSGEVTAGSVILQALPNNKVVARGTIVVKVRLSSMS